MAQVPLIEAFSNGNIQPVFELFIAGLGVSYVSDPAITRATTDITYVGGLLPKSISPATSELDLLGGAGKAGSIDVTVAPVADDVNSVERLMSRLTFRGAANATRLSTTYGSGDSGTIVIDDDPTGWRLDALSVGSRYVFYMGKECFWASGLDTVDPFGFTGITRQAWSTQLQAHKVNALHGIAPRITSHLVNWRTQPAEIWISGKRDDGTAIGSWLQYASGFIDENPATDTTGEVSMTIVPWTGITKSEIGSNEVETGLVHGFHDFGTSTSTREVGRQIAVRQIFLRGDAWGTTANGLGGAGAANVTVNGNTLAWQDIFDFNSATKDGHEDSRVGWIEVDGQTSLFAEAAPLAQTFQTLQEVNDATAAGVGTNAAYADESVVQNARCQVDRIFTTPPDVLAWPNEWFETPGADSGFNEVLDAATTQSRTSADYLFVALNAGLNGTIRARQNNTTAKGPCQVLFTLTPDSLWYGFDLMNVAGKRRALERGDFAVRLEAIDAKRGGDDTADEIDTGGFALGFYQGGEEGVLVTEDFWSGEADHWALAKWDDPDYEGGPTESMFRVTSSADSTHTTSASVVGKLVTIDPDDTEDLVSFGDWPGRDGRVRIRPLVRFHRAPGSVVPSSVILQLLLSVNGGANNGVNDLQPYGYGMRPADIDEDRIPEMIVDGMLSRWQFDIRSEVSMDKAIGPMLRAAGYGMGMRLDRKTGRRRLSVIPIGIENKVNSTKTIAAGDWLGHVESGVDDRIVNRWVWKMNWNNSDEKFRLTVIYNDRDSAAEHGETKTHTAEMRGIRQLLRSTRAQQSAFLPIFQARRALFGQARRTFIGKVSYADGMTLDAGAVVTATIDEARDYDGTEGITSQPMLVTKVHNDPVGMETELELVYHGANTTGWAPAMEVTAIGPGADDLTVAANVYSSTDNIVTGETQTDISFFAEAEQVQCVPKGNYGAVILNTIVSISVNDINFSINHGLQVGDTIRAADYDDTITAATKALAYTADANETLGAAADDGYDYN